ncbi:hypothetical protein EDD11_010361 [Mortierella claussenii]|nr:hypothetical protein EDD11_010361 [Mortierella claussenii]
MTHSGSDHHNGMQYSSFYLEWTLQDTDQLWHMQQDLLDLEHALPIPSQQQCNPSWLPFLDKQPQINPQESMDWDLKTLFDDCTPTPSQQQCDQSWSPFLDLQPQINPQGSVDWDLKTLFDDCTMSDSSQYSQPQEILAQQTVIVHYDQFIVPPSEAPENAQCPAPYLQHPADCFYDELSVAMQGPQGSQDVYQCVPPQPNIGSLEPLGHAQQQQLDLSQLQHSATSHTFHQYPDGSASQYVINTFHQQAQFIVQQQAEINQKQVLHRARKFQHQQFDQQHYMQVDAKDIEIPLVQSSSAHAEVGILNTATCRKDLSRTERNGLCVLNPEL